MSKYIVGYCYRCRKKTKHKIIECEDSMACRVFEAVVTVGFSLLFDREYECECTRCGEINTLEK